MNKTYKLRTTRDLFATISMAVFSVSKQFAGTSVWVELSLSPSGKSIRVFFGPGADGEFRAKSFRGGTSTNFELTADRDNARVREECWWAGRSLVAKSPAAEVRDAMMSVLHPAFRQNHG